MNENRKPGVLGRLDPHPEETHPRVGLESHMDLTVLPPAPETIDWCSKVITWPMYLNDQLSDCTCAAVGHQVEAWSAYGNVLLTMSQQAILGLYEAMGYVPGNPSTDNGCVVQDVLQFMVDTGIPGESIPGESASDQQKYSMFAQIKNLKNMETVYQALYLFGSVYIGIDVAQSAMDQFKNNEPWSYAGDDNILGGHAICIQAKLSTGDLNVITWGAVQTMEQSFWDNYVKEAWVVIDPDWISATSGEAPEGLDLISLESDFRSLK